MRWRDMSRGMRGSCRGRDRDSRFGHGVRTGATASHEAVGNKSDHGSGSSRPHPQHKSGR